MQKYKQGKLICEQAFSEEAQASQLVKQKMESWEKTRLDQEKQCDEQCDVQLKERKQTFKRELKQTKKEAEDKIRNQENIEQQYALLEKSKQEFEEEKKAMTKYQVDQSSWVKLNIGGIRFETSLSTLSMCKYFKAMFSGRYDLKKDNEGDIIVRIDRDGKYFDYLINFLHNATLPNDLTERDKKALICEADFYGLEELSVSLKSFNK